uniref:FixH family protein n=1 Tax=Flavobacterium sp. TaxID=239 RepID=UPI00404B560C
MKINWGTAIVIAFALFMSFILYFVFKVQSDSKYDNELVTEEYYQKEQEVQGNIEKEQNSNKLEQKVTISKGNEGLVIQFPSDFDFNKISGKVFLYRPSNEKLDSETQISLSSSQLIIPKDKLIVGNWDITIDWEYQGVQYRSKETIYY